MEARVCSTTAFRAVASLADLRPSAIVVRTLQVLDQLLLGRAIPLIPGIIHSQVPRPEPWDHRQRRVASTTLTRSDGTGRMRPASARGYTAFLIGGQNTGRLRPLLLLLGRLSLRGLLLERRAVKRDVSSATIALEPRLGPDATPVTLDEAGRSSATGAGEVCVRPRSADASAHCARRPDQDPGGR